jgi:hypothetical protein
MSKAETITVEEWNRLDSLRREISLHPMALSPQDLEEFSYLFAKSIKGKGDIKKN